MGNRSIDRKHQAQAELRPDQQQYDAQSGIAHPIEQSVKGHAQREQRQKQTAEPVGQRTQSDHPNQTFSRVAIANRARAKRVKRSVR